MGILILIVIMIVLGVLKMIRIAKEKKILKDICSNIQITHVNSSEPIVYIQLRSKEEAKKLVGSGLVRDHCLEECVDRPVCRVISIDMRKMLYTISKTYH